MGPGLPRRAPPPCRVLTAGKDFLGGESPTPQGLPGLPCGMSAAGRDSGGGHVGWRPSLGSDGKALRASRGSTCFKQGVCAAQILQRCLPLAGTGPGEPQGPRHTRLPPPGEPVARGPAVLALSCPLL